MSIDSTALKTAASGGNALSACTPAPQAIRLHGEPLRVVAGDPVVAAQAAVDDLVVIGLDEPFGGEPVESGVQRPGLQLDPPEICATSVMMP